MILESIITEYRMTRRQRLIYLAQVQTAIRRGLAEPCRF